jgi:microcin C transport system substrate-binding protein
MTVFRAAMAPVAAAMLWVGGMLAAPAETVIRAHGVSTFGELKYPEGFAHFDYVNPDAPKGGTFSTWAFGTFDSLSPYILKGNAAIGSSIFFESLMTGTLDEPDSMYGLLAHSVEYPPGREWAIFHLRPEARFSDGTPVTAQDVVFSFNVLLEKGQPAYKVVLKDILSVEAIDDLTVKYTFDPAGALREALLTAAGLPVFSRAYYETRDFAESTLEPPVGSGPYLLGEVKPGQSVSYVLRPDYWGVNLNVNIGTNNFERLSFEYFADYTAAFEAFKGGAYAFRAEFSSLTWATGYDFPAVAAGHVKRETLPDGRPSGTQGFWFNLRRPIFADPRVRQALGMAFNFEWSNAQLFYGLYDRTDSFWENSNMQAEGMPSPEELALLEPLRADLPPEVFTEPAFVPAVLSAETVADRSSLRAAGALLDAAGWTVGADGIRVNAAGERLKIEIMNDNPSFDRIINPYVENLVRLGVEAVSTKVDSAQAQEREKVFDFDIVVQRYSMSLTPGIELRGIFGSEAADTDGSNNIAGLKNPAVDALIAKIEGATSREDLNTAVRALDRALRAMHIWVPQWYKGTHTIAYLDMYDRPYADNPPPSSLGESSIWWFNPAKAEALRAAGAIR